MIQPIRDKIINAYSADEIFLMGVIQSSLIDICNDILELTNEIEHDSDI